MKEEIIDTGFRCSICFKVAQVLCAGESMCVEHAQLWHHGYGKTIKELKEQERIKRCSYPITIDLDKE